MKKYLALAITAIILISCNSDQSVIVRGSYPDGRDEKLSVEMLNVNQLVALDSVKVGKSGKFKIKIDLKNPELILVKNEAGKTINLIPFPNDKIYLDIPCVGFSNCYTVTGSEESSKVKSLVENVSHTKLVLDSIAQKLNTTEDEAESDGLVAEYNKILKAQRMHNIKFIVENISSLSSVYALYQRIGPEEYVFSEMNDLQYMKIVADSVKTRYPNSSLVASLVQDVARRMERYNNLLLMSKLSEKEITGAGSINLTIPDKDGNEISISSLRGKVVLLNFWASSDQTSRESNKVLKSIYKQYHSKGFEVYSIALDNNKAAWMDAVRFEDYKWVDVCELSFPNSYAASVYNIQSIPTTFLIDKEGNIVARNINGKVLGTWLDNLL